VEKNSGPVYATEKSETEKNSRKKTQDHEGDKRAHGKNSGGGLDFGVQWKKTTKTTNERGGKQNFAPGQEKAKKNAHSEKAQGGTKKLVSIETISGEYTAARES